MSFCNFLFKKNKPINKVYSYQRFVRKKESGHRLMSKLIFMVDGNKKKADELIARARFAEPNKSDNYYCYKAIIDLKRGLKDS